VIREKRLPTDVLEKIPGLIETLRACEDVVALFFFGGLSRGEIKPLSDLDLGLLLKNDSNPKKLFERELALIGIIAGELGTEEFDLIILNTAPLRFSHQILRNGKRIFVKDPHQLVDFQEKVVKEYLDFIHYRGDFDRTFLGGLGLHG